MASLSCRPSAALAANQILRLVSSGGHHSLGAELQRIGAVGGRRASESGVAGERWELLQAIAEEMQDSGQDMQPAGMETCVRLLRHLAGDPAQVLAARPRSRRVTLLRQSPPPGGPSCCRP